MKNTPEDQSIRFLTDTYELIGRAEMTGTVVTELDLGCGVGSFTTALAQLYPERTIYAADVMVGRLRKLVKRNRRMGVENVRPLRVEARSLLGYIFPDASLDRIHMLCPDPWPKGRHRGHRLLSSDFLSQVHRVLKAGGVFHFASDDDYYFDAVRALLNGSGIFAEDPSLKADVAGVRSDFEVRWLAMGKAVRHTAWRTLPRVRPAAGH